MKSMLKEENFELVYRDLLLENGNTSLVTGKKMKMKKWNGIKSIIALYLKMKVMIGKNKRLENKAQI